MPQFKQATWSRGVVFLLAIAALQVLSPASFAASWTTIPIAPSTIQIMVQLTDGTILAQSYADGKSWMKYTPDSTGNYANGTWSMLAPGPVARLYFTSQVLQDGRFFLVGGEYTGPGLNSNWAASGEIYDPVANSWTAITPFPAQTGCPSLNYVVGDLTNGSRTVANVYPYTTQLVVGSTVTGTGIQAGTTIQSIDSSSQMTLSLPATATTTGVKLTLGQSYRPISCVGDVPSVLLSGGRVLIGNLVNQTTWIYNVATDTWTQSGSKVYADQSDEEGWSKLPDGSVITYDLFKSKANPQGSYAEKYDPTTGVWTSISPSDGTANGFIPQLSSNAIGSELGPPLRLQDGRVLILGATQHTALYDPATNTWSAGPDIMGTLTNSQGTVSAPFGSDDAPAAELPNGHVIFGADPGIDQITTPGNLATGSRVITNLGTVAGVQVGWGVSGTGIPSGATVSSVDSASQVTISAAATATATQTNVKFGATFSGPTQLFDFNPADNTINPLTPPVGANLAGGVYPKRFLILPTGQVFFSDATRQIYLYTPDGAAAPQYRPAINSIVYNGSGQFTLTLTGKQLNGQSAGASYGDDDEMDANYPLVRFTATDGSGKVYYGKTTNWSSLSVGGGLSASATQTVNVTLNPALTAPGTYAMTVIGAGIPSLPLFVNITQSEINKQ